MTDTNSLLFSGLGVVAGGLIAVQSVLNATLGQRVGSFGSLLVLTVISATVLVLLIRISPSTSDLGHLPGIAEWHLYLGGVLGVLILAAPIFLVPRIGTASTLIAIVLGQTLLALLIDHFGLFASPKIDLSGARLIGILLVAVGAYLVSK